MRIRCRRASRVIAVTIAVIATAAASAQAPAKKIDASRVCRSCVLRIEKVVTLADPVTAMGSSNNLAGIDRDSRGRYWVADYRSRMHVLVFAPNGTLIKRIGREGKGPGEFTNVVSLLVGPGDTIHAFDRGSLRRAEISPTTLEIVAQYPIPEFSFGMMMAPTGNFIAAASAPDRTGHPFEEFNRAGERVRHFGGDGKTTPSYVRPWATRRMVPDRNGGFYSISRRNYIVDHFDQRGRLTGSWERGAEWFPFSPPVQRQPPLSGKPSIFAAWVNPGGLLFVGSLVRQKGWEKALGNQKDETGRPFQGVEDYDGYYDTIIEVVDMKTSQLIASVRDDRYFIWSAANGEIYRRGDDEESIEIFRVIFNRR
jgi:hypothetical protein